MGGWGGAGSPRGSHCAVCLPSAPGSTALQVVSSAGWTQACGPRRPGPPVAPVDEAGRLDGIDGVEVGEGTQQLRSRACRRGRRRACSSHSVAGCILCVRRAVGLRRRCPWAIRLRRRQRQSILHSKGEGPCGSEQRHAATLPHAPACRHGSCPCMPGPLPAARCQHSRNWVWRRPCRCQMGPLPPNTHPLLPAAVP